MSRILVIEDETSLAASLQKGLEDERHIVDVEHDGEAGLWAAQNEEYDLVVLDLMLPRLAGLEVCKRLRGKRNGVPILILTARDATDDVVAGLDAGADDYMTKPFAFEELVARVRTLLRRAAGAATSRLRAGPLEVDVAAHQVWRDGEEIELTMKEFQLLEALVRRQGMVLSKARLADALWARDEEPMSNAIEVYVSSLRRKVDRDREPRLIHTIRGVGYVLRPEAS